MRSVLLCTLLLAAWSSPVFGQQLKEITNSIGMKLVLIHAGSFTMGSPISEEGRREDESPHEVTISKSFYLGMYEVTQTEYEKVTGVSPSRFKGSLLPVEMVSWEDSVLFCERLSELQKEKDSEREYRLPTEAEWEYACRATSTASFCFGDKQESLGDYTWFHGNSGRVPHPVGEKKANRWGLFDMHGNVFEWCQDWYAEYPAGEETDPQGPQGGSTRVRRGGCWFFVSKYCRASLRDAGAPPLRSADIGFRVAMTPPIKKPVAAFTK